MTPPWPPALADAPPSVQEKRFRIAQQALIDRARPGTFFYVALAAFYVPLVIDQSIDLAVTLVTAAVLFLIGIGRLALYRATPTLDITPDRWRTYFALGAGAMICCWDTFAAFEIWHREMDAACVILVAASLAFRASGTYTACPDLRVHRIFAGPTRIAMLVAPAATGTTVGIVLSCILMIHTLYVHVHGRQLNEEYWRGIVATEEAKAAHEELQREVAMRERAEVELRLAQKLESVGRLAAGVAHEINTPLQAMMANIEFLQEGVDELLAMAKPSPEQEGDLAYFRENLPETLAVTQECLERTAAIVRSVKSFAHPELSKKAPLDINRALQTTLDISRHEYSMIADVRTELRELPLVECYPGELNQALLNLVINAAHAIGDIHAQTGKRGTITVGTRMAGDTVHISIADTGGGIPDAIRARVFDPFFTTKAVGKGTGQGLAIARSVMERHGGELCFATEIGVGTTFELRLPVGTPMSLAA